MNLQIIMGKKSKFDIAVVDHIRELRISKGYSQDDFAAFLETSRGFIGQIESPLSPSKYNLNHLNRLAFEMKCSPKDLIPDQSFWEELPKKQK
ncbi:helix-turn-helix domain-containing protein [Mongoliitalea daihaiensis]|uniref:helix-turn-helix domain-containing protein n=1 Tax=Mongoliitalea daihaiensis TaxID=2782006 RepID=UPI001F2FA635|nr:helix-turn-helix transcriptional regulator [Mongoliitalea daihaiensis]UJP64884.1 helix-turn-helix transcriptional regulator [Mongoliitalea daihaiensis]